MQIGPNAFGREEMRGALREFASIYDRRPIRDNQGGMKAPHAFLAWFVMRTLQPDTIIESGVWKGQGTWFFEQACPRTDLYCLDINFSRLVYRSARAKYLKRDFTNNDFSTLSRMDTVVFFDDHQNAVERCFNAHTMGFRHLIFEDNYPPLRGDCYSLKAAFLNAGYRPPMTIRAIAGRIIGRRSDRGVRPNTDDSRKLQSIIECYQELPPVISPDRTRWGDEWSTYETPEPLLDYPDEAWQLPYVEEAQHYTWMAYVRLK